MYPTLLWALVALIGHVHCKCSLAPIVDDERPIAYACIHGDLNDLREISSETEWIEFSVSRFQYLPADAFSRFRNLRRLSFYNCHVHFVDDDAFAGLDRLEWLIFHGTKIHVVKAAWFRHLPALRKLILDRSGLVHIEPETFRMLPRLEVLGLRDNDLDCLPIDELSYLRMLRTVRINGNPWLCECRKRLERFFRDRAILREEDCTRGMDVCTNYQCMTPIGISVVPLSLTAHYLDLLERERAALRGNEFETTALTSLDRLPDKTTWIEISGLRIDAIPRYTFFRFGNSLRSLDLNDCSITSIERGAFAGLHKLQRLSLTGNRFATVGADWFRDLVSLQQLILARNEIEQIGRTAFWHLGDSLRHLDIRNNRLRCIAIEELGELKRLERLDATGNPWTCVCRGNLQSFLTDKNIGFEISAGRCYENENEVPLLEDWRRQHETSIESTGVGRVHWTSFEESIRNLNATVGRPTTSRPDVRVTVEATRPPVYQGNCHPEKSHGSRPVYTCTGITSLEELSVVPNNVHTLRVTLSNIGTVPANSFARFDGYLTKLELRDCGIEKIARGAFSRLYNLEHLSLHSNQLDSVTADTIYGLSNLRYLDLSRNQVYRITNDVFDALPYLMGLDVSENLMNCIGVEHMAHRLQYLSVLHVAGNPWSCLCGTKLASFLDSRGIHYDRKALLDMNEECYATNVPVTSTVTTRPETTTATIFTSTRTVETVEGSCTSYDEEDGLPRYRCTGGNLLLLETIPTSVAAIEFHEGHLPNLPAGAFSRFYNLRELVIRNSGVKTIEKNAFGGLQKLQVLTIQDNPLELIESDWFLLENLERLDLRGNMIKYIAPGAFRHSNRLAYLNLEGNDLKCIFTSDLNDMPNVHIIEFSGNPLKWRCRVELEQFLETRKVKFVKVENSCEGKKLVRYLLMQNQTDVTALDCSSDCSAADKINRCLLTFITVLPLYVMWSQ